MTPLVFVHGFLGGSEQWALQRAALEAEFEIIALDLPGFGANAHHMAPATIQDFAAWALDTLSDAGVSTFHLLGHSMGGMIAQEMVAQAPDRVDHLVLYGTGAVGVLPGRFESICTSKARAEADGPTHTARRISATWFLEREDAPSYEACARIAEKSGLGAILAGLDAMHAWSGVPKLAKITSPSLVIWGDHDRTYPWSQTELLWRSLRHCGLAVIPGCAHAVHLEKPDIFNSILRDFLM